MNMKGVTDGNEPGIVDKDAILAGNDLLEFTEDVPKAIAEIRKAINQGLISQEEIDRRCRKILAVKYWVGLKDFEPTSLENIAEELNTPTANLLNRKLTEASLTVLKNKLNILPLKQLNNLKVASVSIGSEKITPFQETLSLYTAVEHFNIKNDASPAEIDSINEKLKDYNLVLAGIHDDSKFPRNTLKMTAEVQEFLQKLIEQKVTVVSLFKNPYVMDKLQNIEDATGLIITYQDSKNSQELAAQLIFGGATATGKLPVSVGKKFKVGEGLPVNGGVRLSYALPEEVGMDSAILNKRIDSLMQQAINAKAIPGGQVLAARNGKVFFHKAYGEHVYHDTIKVKKDDLYDLASVTKISASMAALMKLHDEGKFQLDQTLASHLPSFRRSNKSDLPYSDILTHQAGFKPWIPFWKNTLRKNGSYRWFTIKKDSSARYPIKITDEMYLHRNYPDRIVKEIRKSPVSGEKKYVYSDFFFILAPRVVESMTEEIFLITYNKIFTNLWARAPWASILTFRRKELFLQRMITILGVNQFTVRTR
jgi:beta-N-acetylhexosaminidase